MADPHLPDGPHALALLALDRAETPVFLIDAASRCLWRNRAAGRLLPPGACLSAEVPRLAERVRLTLGTSVALPCGFRSGGRAGALKRLDAGHVMLTLPAEQGTARALERLRDTVRSHRADERRALGHAAALRTQRDRLVGMAEEIVGIAGRQLSRAEGRLGALEARVTDPFVGGEISDLRGRLAATVDQLSALREIGLSGGQMLRPVPLSPRALVGTLLAGRDPGGPRALHLDEIPWVIGDRSLTLRVFGQLLTLAETMAPAEPFRLWGEAEAGRVRIRFAHPRTQGMGAERLAQSRVALLRAAELAQCQDWGVEPSGWQAPGLGLDLIAPAAPPEFAC